MQDHTHFKLKKYIKKFRDKKILVIGDLMVDEYIWGDVTRISPEAPIPVIHVNREEMKPGGAANVILNLISLGAKVYCAGVVGNDANGRRLKKYFKKHRINSDAVIEDGKRPTTVKTRVIAHNQQVVRIDKEKKIPVSRKIIEKMLAVVEKEIHKADGIVFSDYNKGVITKNVYNTVMSMAGDRITAADPKPGNMKIFSGVTIISPNKKEAAEAAGIEPEKESDIIRAGKKIKKELGAKAVLITRGEEGMSLFEDREIFHVHTAAKEVYDVTGAGDTVISAAALMLCAGASFKEAAVAANIAAGISVAEIGVHAVSAEELRRAMNERKCG
ncbi:MAG: D-glycero-beta-D-manno-heptose-7-phosphate kinase [Candidatus Goldiibacteriota bacterium]